MDTGVRLKDLVRTSRPLLWLNTAVLALLAPVALNRPLEPGTLLLVAYFTLPFNLYLHGINDVYDYESDLLNARKGGAEGDLLPRTLHAPMLRWLFLINAPFVLLLLASGPLLANALLLLFLVLGWAYSAPPIRGKSRPFLDNLINAAYILPLLIGLARLGVPPAEWPWPAIVAFVVWSLASHAFTSIQDIEADRAAGINTIATLLGARASSAYALALYGLAALLAAGYGRPWGALALVYPALVLWYLAGPGRARANRLYRAFIFANSTLGFIVTMTLIVANPRTVVWAGAVALALVTVVAGALRYAITPAQRAASTPRGRSPAQESLNG